MSYQTIFDRLRGGGLSETGALALIGNWECESNCEPCRVQGDFSADRHVSRDYASSIDNALISDNTFCRDARGWGLAQWTFWTRKQGLLLFCRARAISVASEEAQVDFALKELREDYAGLLDFLRRTDELHAAVSRVCCEYERPAVNNVLERYEAALRVKGLIDTAGNDSSSSSAPQNDTGQTGETEERFWPPRMLCKGMEGADVMALQALLFAHGYNCGSVSGAFDGKTRNMVFAFQAENRLDQDGVVGPKTWAAITNMEVHTNERT